MRKLLFASVATAALLAGGNIALAQGAPGATPERHGQPAQGAAPGRETIPGARGTRPETNGQAPAREVQGRPEERGVQQNGRGNEPRAVEQHDPRAPQNPATRQGGRPQTTGQGARENQGARPDNQGARENQGARPEQQGARPGTEPERQGAQQRPGGPETTGQGARGPALSAEQRTHIRTTILHENVRPVTNVNFNVVVGTVVPRTIEMRALPAEIIAIEPAWRGYEFFLVNDEIVVVDPNTLQIVEIIT